MRVSDPGHRALHAAVRTAIISPVALAIGEFVVDNGDVALFAIFATFAHLLFSEFAGPPRVQVAAGAVLVLVGAALITIGTLVSETSALVAAAAMAVVAFVLLFAGILDAHVAAGANAALLSFIIAVMVPAGAADLPDRLAGWAIGGALAIAGRQVIWPNRGPDPVRAAAAAACRALADLVAGTHERRDEDGASAAVRTVLDRYVGTPSPPTGATAAGAATASLVDELQRMPALAVLAPTAGAGAEAVRRTSGDVLRQSAACLTGERRTVDLDDLARAQGGLIDGLAVARTLDDDTLREGLRSTWRLRELGATTRRVGELARAVAGAAPRRRDESFAALRRLAADHLTLRSAWLRTTLRSTAGLTAAVYLGRLTSLQHAFWLVLGTLSVLRSTALRTSASALQAVVGTTVGIVIGGAVVFAIGTDTTVLWVLLPPAVLVAAYAPRAMSFAAGQAGFSVSLMILFNIIAPSGWEVGLVRIEDVALGVAISVLVGLLFWPRGAAAVLRDRLAEAYRGGAAYLATSVGRLADGGPADGLAVPRQEAVARERLLDAVLRQFLAEGPPPRERVDAVVTLRSGAVDLRLGGDSLAALAPDAGGAPPAGQDVPAWYAALGSAIAERRTPPAPDPTHPDLPPEVLAGVRAAGATSLVWGGEHLQLLRDREERLAAAAGRLAP